MDRILFFDGTCAMCNGLVNLVLKYDKNKLFKFAPLAGLTAKKLLPENLRSELSTAVLLDHHGVHTKSDAIITLLCSLGGFFKLLKLSLIFPRFLRDQVYQLISKNRYRLFGKIDHCAIHRKEDQERILE